MSYKIELLPRARKELLEAWEWYDERWNGSGDRFLREVEKKLQLIEKTPERFVNAKKDFVRLQLKFFPISLYTVYTNGKR